MSLEVLQLSIANSPFKIIGPTTMNKVCVFTLPSGQIFIGPDNTVTSLTGFSVPFGPVPTTIPVPIDTELWAVSDTTPESPVKVYVTLSDGGLSNTELRATPVAVDGTISVDTGNLATSAKQDTGNTSLASIDGKLTSPIPITVSGPNPLPCSGTIAVSNFPATQPVSGTVSVGNFPATQPVSIASMPSTPVTGTFFPATQPISRVVGASPVADQCVTATGTAGAAVTATLPAVVGQFHYITSITIQSCASANMTPAATPTVVTSTNLPGSVAWVSATTTVKGAIDGPGTMTYPMPMKSSAANTNTTIVCPATANVIWRVTVHYAAAA